MGCNNLNPLISQPPNQLGCGPIRQNSNRVIADLTIIQGPQQSEVEQPPNQIGSAPIQQNPNRVDAQLSIAKDAYQIAKTLDPSIGTREEWIASLQGADAEHAGPTWIHLINEWSEEPTLLTTIVEGEVYEYTYDAVTYYRLVPTPYDSAVDAFYSTFTSGVLAGKIVARSQP